MTLKNFVTPWTNRDQTVFAPLNDYTATVIGMVRDDVPFNTAAVGRHPLYGRAASVARPYSPTNNDHYAAAERPERRTCSAALRAAHAVARVYGMPAAATAGRHHDARRVAQAFFIAGTNRAMFRFTLINHLCRDLEQVQDTSRPPDRIRQDVSRSPGGDSRIFLNNCIGCHSGMDPMAQAFAYYDFDETQSRLVYTPGAVQPKYLINADNFKPGFVTPDDRWENRWRAGPNARARLERRAARQRQRREVARARSSPAATRSPQCQVEKVFKAVCFRAPGNASRSHRGDRIIGASRRTATA